MAEIYFRDNYSRHYIQKTGHVTLSYANLSQSAPTSRRNLELFLIDWQNFCNDRIFDCSKADLSMLQSKTLIQPVGAEWCKCASTTICQASAVLSRSKNNLLLFRFNIFSLKRLYRGCTFSGHVSAIQCFVHFAIQKTFIHVFQIAKTVQNFARQVILFERVTLTHCGRRSSGFRSIVEILFFTKKLCEIKLNLAGVQPHA